MKKTFQVLSALMSMVLFSTSVFAAAWYVPTNVRIVQQSNTDTTGRIYGSIQAALNSITNASASSPYVIKIMPGIYDLGTASLQMKDYVDLEGSSPDNTIITTSNYNVDSSTCTTGTVLMANNSSIRNLKVINNPPALGGSTPNVAALVFNNVKAKAEEISVLTGSDSVAGGQNNGVCTFGTSANAFLNNVTIETHNNGMGQSNPIYLMGGSATVTNSRLTGINSGGGWITLINNNSSTPVNVTVNNSTLTGTNLAIGGLTGIFSGSSIVSILNSTMSLNVSSGYVSGFESGSDFTMINTKITSNSPTITYTLSGNYTPNAKIANTLLPGDKSALQVTGVKFVNNYDENYNPIPNQ